MEIRSLLPPFANAPNLNMPLDVTVLVFTMMLAVVSGIFFGLAPALRASKPDLVADLKERTGSAATPHQHAESSGALSGRAFGHRFGKRRLVYSQP
jgi:hypothetical protein